ncbi:protein piccolo-like [Biomphalaria glabrata]|uniref:Protein piccolo-like n=1 Tax=Biomphalaria glabrata TaxID=6526 RepID=A0A9W3AQG5_BIOGL|nr:protein piccolo-like [Biomphalaria glabrata]
MPAEQLLSAQRTMPAEQLLSGQRTIPAEQLLSAQRTIPAEQLISAQRTIPTEQLLSAHRTIPAEQLLSSQKQLPTEQLQSAQRQLQTEKLISTQKQLPTEQLISTQKHLPNEQLLSAQKQLPTQQHSIRPGNAQIDKDQSVLSESQTTYSGLSAEERTPGRSSVGDTLSKEQKINSNVYFNATDSRDSKSLRQENKAINSPTKSLRQENEATKSQTKSLRQENEATKSQTKSLPQENEATNSQTKSLRQENQATNLLTKLLPLENEATNWQLYGGENNLSSETFHQVANATHDLGKEMRFSDLAIERNGVGSSPGPAVQLTAQPFSVSPDQRNLTSVDLPQEQAKLKQANLTYRWSQSKQSDLTHATSKSKQTPMQQEPSMQKTMYQEQSFQKLMQQEPSMQKPMQQEPSGQKPMQKGSSMQKPMLQEPSMEKSMQQEPSLQKPMLSEQSLPQQKYIPPEQSLPQQKYIPPEQSPTNQNDVSPEQLKSTQFLPKGQAQSKQILTPAEQSQLKEQFLKSEQLVSKRNRQLSKLELSESNQKILPSEQVQLKESEQFIHQQNVLPIYQTLPQQQLPESKQQNLQADLNSKSQFIPSEQLQSKQQFIPSEQLQSEQQFIPSDQLQSKHQFITSEQLQSKQQFIPTERRQVNREEQLHSKKQFIPSEQLQSSKQQFIPSEQLQSSKQQFIPSEQLQSSKQQFIPSEQLQSSKQQFIPSEQLQSKQQFIPTEKPPSKQQFMPTEQLQSKQQFIPPEKLQSKQQLIPPDQRQFNREEQLQSKQKFIPSEKLQSKQQFIPTEQLQSKLQFIPPEKLVSKHQFNPTEQLYLNQQLSPEMAQLNHQNVRSDQSQRIISSEQIQSNQKHLIPSELHSSESAQSTKAQNQPRLAHQLTDEQKQPRLAHQLTDEQNQPRLAHQPTEESSLKVRTQFNVGKPNSSMKVSLKPSFNPTALSNTSRVEELRTLPSKDNIHLDNERTSRDLEKNMRSHSKTPDDTNKPSVFSNDTFEVNKAFPLLDSKAEAGKTIGGLLGSKDQLVSKKTSSTLDRTQASANVTRATANNIPIVQVTLTDDQIMGGNKSIATDNKVPLNVSFNPMSKLEVTDIKEHNSSLLLSKGEKRARDPKYRIPPGAEEWYRNNRLLSMEIVLGPQPVFDLKPPASGHRKSLDSVKTNKLLTSNKEALTSNLKGKISLTKNNTTVVTNGKANKSFPKSTLPKEAIIESARNSIESDLPFNVFVDNKTKFTSDRVRNSTSSVKPIYREDNLKQDTPDKTKTAIYNIFGRRKSFNTPDVKKIPADDPKYSSVNVVPKNQPIERKPQKMRKNAASKYSEQTRSKSNMSPLLKILQNSSKPFLKSDEESDALFNQDMTTTLKTFRRKGKPGKDRSEDNIIDNLQESNKNALSNSPSTSSDNSRENRQYVSTYLSEKSENLDTSINTELSCKSGDHGQPIGASSYQNSGSEKAQAHLSGVIEEDKSKVIRGHHGDYNSLNSKNTVISLELPTTFNEMHSRTDEDAGFSNDSVSVKAKLDPYLNPGSLVSPNTGTLGYGEQLNVAFESSVDPEITQHPKIDAVKVQSATKNLFSTPVQDIIKVYGSSVDLDHLPENDIASAMDALDLNKQLLPTVTAKSGETNEKDRSTIVIDSRLNEKHSPTVALETNQKGDNLSPNDVFDARSSETSHKPIYLTDSIGAKLFMEIPQRDELYAEMIDLKGEWTQETSSIESLEIAAALASSTDEIFPVQPETVEENRLTEQQRAHQPYLKSRDNGGSWFKNNDDSGIGSLKSPIFKQDRQREEMRKRPKLAPQLPTFSSFIDKRKWGNSSFGQRKKKEPPKAKPRVVSECFYYSDLNMMQLTLKPVNWPTKSHESPGDLSTHAININFHTSPMKKPSSTLIYSRARSQSMKRSVNV